MAINVLGFQHARNNDGTVNKNKGYFYPLHISRKKDAADTVDLLLLDEEDAGGDKKHHVLIKSLSALLYDTTNSHKKKHFCMWCLRG